MRDGSALWVSFKTMEHQFCIEIASKYGIEEAIIVHNLFFWINKNVANDKHLHDGRYWTYNSSKAFSKLFPYMNEHKIYRVLKSLETKKVILKGNYNPNKYIHTNWYAFTDQAIYELYRFGYDTNGFAKSISQKQLIDFVNSQKGNSENAKSNNTDNKETNNKTDNNNGDDGKFVGEVENYDAKAYTSPSDYNIENQQDRQRLVSDLLSQSLWIETLQRSFGLNAFQLPQAIDECIDEMILGGEKTKSLQDAKSHIRNLLRKKQQFKKTPGAAAAEKSWKERFTEIAVQKLTAQPKEPDNDKPFWL